VSKPLTIALDVMGGDKGPDMVLQGAELALVRFPAVRFVLVGDETRIVSQLDRVPALKSASIVLHAEDVVASDAKPSAVLRSGKRTSMRLAIDAVADGRADCAVSAGNTGALMAMAKMVLKTMPGIDRPALASFLPTARGETVLLDMGANVECSGENLVQFALMGDAFARAVFGLVKPTIGLLNVGSEEVKGNDAVREANTRLRAGIAGLIYHGFVEGDDIAAGTVDVIVTDGFSGNIALKTAEGVAGLYAGFVRHAFRSSFLARIGALFARPALLKLRERLDPRRYNGAMFLGLNGIIVKSHGGADAFGFANAIAVAHDLSSFGFAERIKAELAALAVPAQPEPV
jgi:glycerol-3-phosphate acyltransferase PlsX